MLGIVPQGVNFNQFETLDEILINQAGFYGILVKRLSKVKLFAEKIETLETT